METAVLFSGGPDSTAAALWAKQQGSSPVLMTLHLFHQAQYGELRAAIRVAELLGLEHTILDLTGYVASLGPGPIQILMHAGETEMGESETSGLLPFGAGTALSACVSYCLARGGSRVVWGATLNDGASSPQYTQEFADGLAELVSTAIGQQFSITLPFAQMYKPQVTKSRYVSNQDLFAETWSCKVGTLRHCGKCEACRARHVAAEIAGIEDATSYEVTPSIELPSLPSNLDDFTEDDWRKLHDAVPMKSPKAG